MFCQPQCPLLGAHLQEAFSLLPVESPPLAGGPNTTTTTSEHIPWKRNGTEENEIFRDNMSDPDVVLVLKHKTLWIKLHVQVSECKWRTHTNSILWPICLQLRHGKSVFIHLLVHHGAKKGKKKGLSSSSVGYWAKPDLFLELSHLVLSNSDMMWCCYLYRIYVLRFPYYPRYP